MASNSSLDISRWRQAIEHICSGLGWETRTQSSNGHTLIICPLSNDKIFTGVLFVISSNARRLVVYVIYRTKLSLEYHIDMSEAVAQINSGLLGGCLEFDFESGEVRYRDGFLLVEPDVDMELLRATLATVLRDAPEYYAIIESISTGSSSEQALNDFVSRKETPE